MSAPQDQIPSQEEMSTQEQQHPIQDIIDADPNMNSKVREQLMSRMLAEELARQAIINAEEEEEQYAIIRVTKTIEQNFAMNEERHRRAKEAAEEVCSSHDEVAHEKIRLEYQKEGEDREEGVDFSRSTSAYEEDTSNQPPGLPSITAVTHLDAAMSSETKSEESTLLHSNIMSVSRDNSPPPCESMATRVEKFVYKRIEDEWVEVSHRVYE